MGEIPLSQEGLTIRQYFRKLHQKMDTFTTLVENIDICEQKFKEMADR